MLPFNYTLDFENFGGRLVLSEAFRKRPEVDGILPALRGLFDEPKPEIEGNHFVGDKA